MTDTGDPQTTGAPQTEKDRALLALADSNDRLADVVGHNKRERRVGSVVAGAALVVLLLFTSVTAFLVYKVRDGQKSGHQLLKIATDATSPAAQAAQAAQLNRLVGQIILCVDNHADHASNPRVVLIASCPQPEVTP